MIDAMLSAKRTTLLLAWAAAAILASACGSSVVAPGVGGGFTECCPDPDVPGCPECEGGGSPGTSNVASSSGVGGAGGDISCGGFAGDTCAPDEYCDFPDDLCGGDDGTGICVKRPDGCPNNYLPTCGCDGMVHGNPCDAAASGFDVSTLGNCEAPGGTFACGAGFCEIETSFCQHIISDVFEEPDEFTCKGLPATCGAPPSCACVDSVACAGSCKSTPEGGIVVSCGGG